MFLLKTPPTNQPSHTIVQAKTIVVRTDKPPKTTTQNWQSVTRLNYSVRDEGSFTSICYSVKWKTFRLRPTVRKAAVNETGRILTNIWCIKTGIPSLLKAVKIKRWAKLIKTYKIVKKICKTKMPLHTGGGEGVPYLRGPWWASPQAAERNCSKGCLH